MDAQIRDRARQLISKVAEECTTQAAGGSFTATVYDTAWLSMLRKRGSHGTHWVFPQCFNYVLHQQNDDGSWPAYAAPIDSLLNSLAALLALKTHAAVEPSIKLGQKIERGRQAVEQLLESWDVGSTVHVGFEILVPSLLQQLECHGLVLQFQNKPILLALYNKKMTKFNPEILYQKHSTTLLHSLEAFVGMVSYDKVRHHLQETGMLASPASTAAYLMHCTTWEDDAERYLRTVYDQMCTADQGIPSAFPTDVFEASWTLSTLLLCTFQETDFDAQDVRKIVTHITELLASQDGITGFTLGATPDADDTAKCLLSLSLLRRPADVGPLVRNFDAEGCFKTFQLESSPSFSANCNVLVALLSQPDLANYQDAVSKICGFLCSQWNQTSVVRDKWNLSVHYSCMLLSHGLVLLLRAIDQGRLPAISESMGAQVAIVLSQIISRTLASQAKDGSWTQSVEKSAYAAITLATCLGLPLPLTIRDAAQTALQRSREYLWEFRQRWDQAEYLWVEKLTYGSPVLSETYCLAAMKIDHSQSSWQGSIKDMFSPHQNLTKIANFCARLLVLKPLSPSAVEIASLEASLYVQQLRSHERDIFPPQSMGTDTYMKYIPFTWTACNQVVNETASPECRLTGEMQWQMMLVSMFNYQVDGYMETVVKSLSQDDVGSLTHFILTECGIQDARAHADKSSKCHSGHSLPTPPSDDGDQIPPVAPQKLHVALSEVRAVLQKYIAFLTKHPAVVTASKYAQHRVAAETRAFLLSHLEHNQDNAKLASQTQTETYDTNRSYLDWVRSTGCTDTSCPASFAFYTCLIDDGSQTQLARHDSAVEGAQAKYYSQALARHLATMCRQYNDLGSIVRDQEELNLNSLQFVEFTTHSKPTVASKFTHDHQPAAKGPALDSSPRHQDKAPDLLKIAQYERGCMELARDKLASCVSDEVFMTRVQTFIDVTDLYGQIYVARDINSQRVNDQS